jgi:ABC-type dipeptide/oligopeptide/nickel transport system ATPase subunit
VHNAGYQTGHHDVCLQGTRESVLDDIMRWARAPQGRHVFWLNGLAGTGKSTIAQTFAEMVAKNGTLGASFFCSRDYLDRKELKNIFPTLAYQLACRYPAFRSQIIHVIKQDPSVAQNSLLSQLKELIVDPLSSMDIPCVIVVDALDECVDDQPASAILSVLGRLVKRLPSVKFFITGRPEPRIRTGFRLPLLEPFTQIFLLHEVELSNVDEDIRLYLQEKLTAVAKRRSDFDLTDSWPCDEDLTVLTEKSSGLFIFASTLARFIESEYHEPCERLRLIVTPPESTVHEGRAGIDPLYSQVLFHAFSEARGATVFANLRKVLGAVLLAFNTLSRT